MTIIVHESNGLHVSQRSEDGYINLTELCKAGGKRFNNWYQLATTKDFLEELSLDTGIPVSQLIEVRKGGLASEQHTWGHPEVAVDCARWVSVRFRIQVNRWVIKWMMTGVSPLQTKRSFPVDEIIDQLAITLKQLINQSKVNSTNEDLLQFDFDQENQAPTSEDLLFDSVIYQLRALSLSEDKQMRRIAKQRIASNEMLLQYWQVNGWETEL